MNNTERFVLFSSYLFVYISFNGIAANSYAASGDWMIAKKEVQKVHVAVTIG